MLRRHFIINSGDSTTLINGGLPKDIPNNTIYYWTTENVERINEALSAQFKCYDNDNTQLELVSNVITNNVGIITMSGTIQSFQFIFVATANNFLDVRYIQLPKSCLGGSLLATFTNLHELYIDSQITKADTILIFPYILVAPNLHIIKVDENNLKYDSRNNCNAIIETETNTLIIGCKNTIIPNDVTSIGAFAFVGNIKLYIIDIPDNINYIKRNAFDSCRLTSITLPININIGEEVFNDCIDLTEINYKGTIEQWNNVEKGNDWNKGVPATVVHCTDGDVEL